MDAERRLRDAVAADDETERDAEEGREAVAGCKRLQAFRHRGGKLAGPGEVPERFGNGARIGAEHRLDVAAEPPVDTSLGRTRMAQKRKSGLRGESTQKACHRRACPGDPDVRVRLRHTGLPPPVVGEEKSVRQRCTRMIGVAGTSPAMTGGEMVQHNRNHSKVPISCKPRSVAISPIPLQEGMSSESFTGLPGQWFCDMISI
jgi:hypothetical protein